MVERDRTGAIHDRLDLMYGVALPKEDESWLWPVAPFGEAGAGIVGGARGAEFVQFKETLAEVRLYARNRAAYDRASLVQQQQQQQLGARSVDASAPPTAPLKSGLGAGTVAGIDYRNLGEV